MTPLPVRLACLSLIAAALAACAPRGTYPAHPLALQYARLASQPSPVQPLPTPAALPGPAAATVQDSTVAAPLSSTTTSVGAHRPSGLPGLQHVDLASYPSPIPPGSATAGAAPKAAPSKAAAPPPATVRPHPGSTPPAIIRPTYAEAMDRMRRIEEDARRDSEWRLEAMAREMERDRQERERQREQDQRDQEYREAALRDQMERDRRYHQERESARERERERERDRQREEARRDQERHDHARNREQAQRDQAQRDQADRERRERDRDNARRDQDRRDQQAEREREQARRDQMERDRRAAADRARNERPVQYGPGPAPTDWRARQQSNSLERP